MSSTRKRDDDDGVFDDNDDDDSDDDEEGKEEKQAKPPPKKKKKMDRSFFDDAAEESGEEGGGGDDDDDDDDDEDNNDYVKDDFVVGEDDEEETKKKKGDLDDSDDEEEDDDSDDGGGARKKSKFKKFRKMRDRLLDDDLDLVREARGETVPDREAERLAAEEAAARREEIRARNADELQRGLFHDSGEEGDGTAEPSSKKPKFRRPQRSDFDEDGLDDFIEDDIGDQGDIMASERREFDEGDNRISEAQLHEASEIFGTDYLEFMGGAQDEEEEELMGKREGINYGYESEEDDISDDDDIFGDDEAGEGSAQKAEAVRLKREQKRLEKAERRKKQQQERAKKRKEALRRIFEPVQLVENFCTDRDDEIRAADVPERFFEDKEHLANPNPVKTDDPVMEEERTHATWMMNRIPDIKAEYASADENVQKTILESIVFAFRFMKEPQYLEPAFIKRYRRDYVTSNAVQENLYTLLDEDKEFKRILSAKSKVAELIQTITNEAEVDRSKGSDSNQIAELKTTLEAAKRQLDENEAEIISVKAELEAISKDDDDDDELFGDDNDKKEVRIVFWSKELSLIGVSRYSQSLRTSGKEKRKDTLVSALEHSRGSLFSPQREGQQT